MPEYLAPGVYVEEVSFRSKSIEGVPTSTTAFAGMTAFGPVRYPGGPKDGKPRLITSFADFEQVYGGLGTLRMSDEGERVSYLAHAARAFFMNGGKRLYVSRVFLAPPVDGGTDAPTDGRDPKWGVARGTALDLGGGVVATWRARWPGAAGNVKVSTAPVRSKNIAYVPAGTNIVQANRAKGGALVEVLTAAEAQTQATFTRTPTQPFAPLDSSKLWVVKVDADGRQTFWRGATQSTPAPGSVVQLVELSVTVEVSGERVDVYGELGAHGSQKRFVGRILGLNEPADENAVVWLDVPADRAAADPATTDFAVQLAVKLTDTSVSPRLTLGNDGALAQPDDLAGKEASPDDANATATGLAALGEIDDIAIVALPDGGTYDDATLREQAADRLINHAERLRYRIAVVDGPRNASISQIRAFRGRFDSKYAALYHPWIEILDPTERAAQGAPPRRLMLPPSGFVTGIYARSDVERGVHKAPANEVVAGLTRFEANINHGRQEVLNPEGINALRFFEGRGNRVWGARTISSDPEWKYVNVRRLFIYLEHSIDKGTQWAVFEPNNERLWANIRQTIEDFLYTLWRSGALMGTKPEEAYFVRCDRTTMSQNDIDNGRLVCLIGVAPSMPAEFVIFRVGQWTAGSKVV